MRHKKHAQSQSAPASESAAPAQSFALEQARNAASQSLPRRTMLQWMGATLGGLGLLHTLPSSALATEAPVVSSTKTSFWATSPLEALTAIHTRRSQRDFTGEPVPQGIIQEVLSAGMSAPSAQNTQPWEFVVLSQPASIQRIAQVQPVAGYAAKAGAAILLCTRIAPNIGEQLSIVSCACCGQNMLLAAHALGYGAVWIQIYPTEERMSQWKQILKLPADVIPLSFIAMGKAISPLPPVNRMDDRKIHHETW